MAHADVVPEGKGWPHNPFEIREKEGVITGRGVADDKGPLLQSYYALKALRDNNLIGNYKVRFLVGGNEESGSRGMIHYFDELKKLGVNVLLILPHFKPSFSPYVVADYEQPCSLFGSWEQFTEFTAFVESLGIDRMIDIPFNHADWNCAHLQREWYKEYQNK